MDGDFKAYTVVYVRSPVTGVTLDETELNLKAGGEPVRLTAAVQPADASNRAVTWSVSNPDVITVDQYGFVTPVGPGTCIVTVMTSDGEKKAYCVVTVTQTAEESILITGVTTGNNQANVNFAIKSDNGKGYTVYLSETGADESFAKYTNVNYNAKGAHIKGLTNGRKYYVYIEYNSGSGNISRSDVVSVIPQK